MRAHLFLALCLLALPSMCFAISVEEAYRAIPHNQVPYRVAGSSASPEKQRFLEQLFALSDRALVLRIETMQALSRGDRAGFARYQAEIHLIREALSALSEPQGTSGLTSLLSDALRFQEAFFRKWGSALRDSTPFSVPRGDSPTGTDGDISRSSAHLRRLYSELLSRFPEESAHNKSAFFSHLCALDFI